MCGYKLGCFGDLQNCKGESTPRELATAPSENCYRTELNTWNWHEQLTLRKRQRNCYTTRGRLRARPHQGNWQPHLPRIVIGLSRTRGTDLNNWHWGNGNAIATQLEDDWGRGDIKETGNRNFRELSDWVEHVELNWAAETEETATQLLHNSRTTEGKATSRKLATATSKNCYQTELNTWNWTV
jgi:hypothetical protein